MTPMWTQFRRLLLGTLIELLQDAGADVDLPTVRIDFHPGSDFRVPRLNNYMRFTGVVEAHLDDPIDDPDAFRRTLADVWPDILAIVDLPIGDRLTSTKNETSLELEEHRMVIRFDLEAD